MPKLNLLDYSDQEIYEAFTNLNKDLFSKYQIPLRITFWCWPDYENVIQVADTAYPSLEVKGNMLHEILEEFFRRKGFDQSQKAIALEPPKPVISIASKSIDPDDEIPF